MGPPGTVIADTERSTASSVSSTFHVPESLLELPVTFRFTLNSPFLQTITVDIGDVVQSATLTMFSFMEPYFINFIRKQLIPKAVTDLPDYLVEEIERTFVTNNVKYGFRKGKHPHVFSSAKYMLKHLAAHTKENHTCVINIDLQYDLNSLLRRCGEFLAEGIFLPVTEEGFSKLMAETLPKDSEPFDGKPSAKSNARTSHSNDVTKSNDVDAGDNTQVESTSEDDPNPYVPAASIPTNNVSFGLTESPDEELDPDAVHPEVAQINRRSSMYLQKLTPQNRNLHHFAPTSRPFNPNQGLRNASSSSLGQKQSYSGHASGRSRTMPNHRQGVYQQVQPPQMSFQQTGQP